MGIYYWIKYPKVKYLSNYITAIDRCALHIFIIICEHAKYLTSARGACVITSLQVIIPY